MKVYLDSNVPMYAAERNHTLKAPAVGAARSAAGDLIAVSSVQVLQEVLYRYSSNGEYEKGRIVFDAFRNMIGT